LRRLFILILVLLLPFVGSAQVKKPWNDPGYDNKPVHFGFSLGFNTMDLSFKRSLKSDIISNPILIPDLTNPKLGFQVQIVSNFRINENLDVRFLPGLDLPDSRKIIFYNLSDKTEVGSIDYKPAFIEFPLDLKYRTRRLNNYRPYILGGFNYRYIMGGKENTDLKLRQGDLYYEMGVGIDFYLPYFKLSTELKAGMGLFDLLIRDPGNDPNFQSSIDKINSSIVGLAFHFE
jgi:hypothetical protein